MIRANTIVRTDKDELTTIPCAINPWKVSLIREGCLFDKEFVEKYPHCCEVFLEYDRGPVCIDCDMSHFLQMIDDSKRRETD